MQSETFSSIMLFNFFNYFMWEIVEVETLRGSDDLSNDLKDEYNFHKQK
jgi:hypothetical protein